MKYEQYTLDDFLMDRHFRVWVLTPTATTTLFWQDWLAENPEKQPLVEEAAQIILAIEHDPIDLSPQKRDSMWQRITAALASEERAASKATFTRFTNGYQVAAVLIGVLIVSIVALFLLREDTTQLTTAYGEKKQYLLPDSSVVILNAHSTLQYTTAGFQQNRAVRIEGEAYFDIKKQLDQQGHPCPFIVYTEALTVEVLGTEFNVNTRRTNTEVVLTEGNVKLKLAHASTRPAVYMNPGDMVTYEPKGETLHKALVNPNAHTAWKSEELVFKDTPVIEIIHLLEDNYGLQIVLRNKALAQRRYTGTFHKPSPEIILLSLKNLFDLRIERKEELIILN